VISIKKFLSLDKEAERAPMHVVRALIQGIGEHAIAGEADDCARFRECIRTISDALIDGIAPEQLLVHTGAVLRALEDHNRRTSRQMALHFAELQNMVKMLTGTIGAVSVTGSANISRLSGIEKLVASASELDDVRLIKTRLSDCLTDIRSEAERQRKDNRATVDQLTQGLDEARKRSPVSFEAPAQDAVTGLPLRPAAETALANTSQAGASAYAAVFVLDRLQAVNLRFGSEVGDEVLREFSRMIQKKLSAGDQLFRWSGPALLALLPRPSSVERVRNEIASIVDTKLEHIVETSSRSIMIPIAARWTVLPTVAAPRLIYQRIDTFAAELAARE
jgi:diguanylate cyclase (GGDEF)-like protein